MKYVELQGCGILPMEEGGKYDCGSGGGNIMVLKDRTIFEDSGDGALSFAGTATREAVEKLYFSYEDIGEGELAWTGGNWILQTPG